jgi:hypothetical protein
MHEKRMFTMMLNYTKCGKHKNADELTLKNKRNGCKKKTTTIAIEMSPQFS